METKEKYNALTIGAPMSWLQLCNVLKEIKIIVTDMQYKKIVGVILVVAEESSDVKTIEIAKLLRLVLNVNAGD